VEELSSFVKKLLAWNSAETGIGKESGKEIGNRRGKGMGEVIGTWGRSGIRRGKNDIMNGVGVGKVVGERRNRGAEGEGKMRG
jgi:hypothetical protein